MKRGDDERYLARCLELAEAGRRWVNPNPMVGCVVVHNGKIVGEGWHKRFGGPHAEIYALKAAGKRAENATLYVNLEPCAHYGKTPPCVDAIIGSGIRRVVASSKDPNPIVGGAGVRKLRSARVEVDLGTLRKEAEKLNEKFFWFMKNRLPYVGVKVAQTLDGKIADEYGESRWITSKASRSYAHRLRSEYDAVLVGAKTVKYDDPELTVRHVKGRNPIRVVIDGNLVTGRKARVCDVRKASTIIVTTTRSLKKYAGKVVGLERDGVQVFGIDSSDTIDPKFILRVLAGLGISSVLIEGGSTTISGFLQRGLVRKVHCFIAPKILGSGLSGFSLKPSRLSTALELNDTKVELIDRDFYMEANLA